MACWSHEGPKEHPAQTMAFQGRGGSVPT
jgi:hypothetical protein